MDVQEGDNSWEHAMEYLAMVREAQYHTQIVLMLYEDTYKPENDPDRFRVSINFSPGTAACQRKVNEKLTAMTEILAEQGEISSGAVTPADEHENDSAGFEPNVSLESPRLPYASQGISLSDHDSSIKYLTKAELVEQIVRPIEEGETVDIDSNLSAIVNTQPVSQEDAAFREWLCSFPEDRKFSPAALRYAAAIFSDAEGHEAVEPLVTLHNSIPLGQMTEFLERIAGAKELSDLIEVPEDFLFDVAVSPQQVIINSDHDTDSTTKPSNVMVNNSLDLVTTSLQYQELTSPTPTSASNMDISGLEDLNLGIIPGFVPAMDSSSDFNSDGELV